ncbi:MAG: thiamine pyrophosphate-dependent dehydrogenase E1 component subunit alpha, partial [Actinomycetales bacterium]
MTSSPMGAIALGLLEPDDALATYRELCRLRRFEDKVYQLFLKGELPGTVHQYQGQEAVAVGVCQALESGDWITSTHRPHGHAIAKGVSMRAALAELYGKATGCCGGKGGSMHLGDPEVGMVPAIAIVAGGVSIVSGMGLAFKLQRTGQVAACFFGEGATNEGAFHEGVNFAAVQRLPIVYVCENNLYGASTPYHVTTLVPEVAERAAAYGIPAVSVDGMNPLAVREATAVARARAAAGDGPTLIEAKTYRFAGHSRGDAKKYRTRDEEEQWKGLDPIDRMITAICARDPQASAALALIDAQVAAEIDDAVEFARSSPDPEVGDAFTDAYAEPFAMPST